MGYSKELSIEEYPSEEDIQQANQGTDRTPGISGRIKDIARGPVGRGVAAVVGFGVVGLALEACAPPIQAEVQPDKTPTPDLKYKVTLPVVQKAEATPTSEPTKEPSPTVIATATTPSKETATSVPLTATAKKEEATATATPAKKELPPEAQAFMKDIKELPALTPEQKKSLPATFEKNWNIADTPMKKLDVYYTLYTNLYARYNQTKDPAVRAEMKKIQDFMASQLEWQKEYKLFFSGSGGFLDE